MPQDSPTAKNDGSAPGVLGDWTEEQNLGQPGDPGARITKKEVKDAFGEKDQGKGKGKGQGQGQQA